MPNSLFEEKLNSGKFIITTEVGPPKGCDVSVLLHDIEILKDKVDAINVTDHQSSVMRFPSIGGCLLVKEHGAEPILQMTCRDRNRMALQADLMFAHQRGINNVLTLTGDSVDVGDHPEAKPVFDLDSVQLIECIKTLQSGKDMAGNELKGSPSFCIGSTVHPEADHIESQLVKFDQKVEAGALFYQTQGIFDMSKLRMFMQYASRYPVKILAGIIVLASARMAKYMNANVPGIMVAQELIDELSTAEKGKGLAKGKEIAARFVKTIADEKLCSGVHTMAVGNEAIVPEIMEMAGVAS